MMLRDSGSNMVENDPNEDDPYSDDFGAVYDNNSRK